MLSRVKSLLKKVSEFPWFESQPLFATYFYILASALSPSRRVFFVISFLYFAYLVYITSSIKKAIFYSFLPFWLFNVGREFTFVAVPKEAVKSPLYPEGRIITFVFSPYFILAVTAILIMYLELTKNMFLLGCLKFDKLKMRLVNRWKKFPVGWARVASTKSIVTQLKIDKYLLFFLVTFALFFVSSLFTSYHQGFSFLFTTGEYAFLTWLVLGIMMVRLSIKKEIGKLLTTLFLILYGLLVFEAGVTYLQFFKRSTLGLTVEKVLDIPSFGFGADENRLQFRPVGLSYHANSLANYQVSLLVTLIILWLFVRGSFSKKTSETLLVSSSALSLSIIILTLSRSAYISLFIFVGIVTIFNFKESLKAITATFKYLERYKLLVLGFSLFFIFVASDRILNSVYALTETGGLSTRAQQIKEAIQLLHTAPFLGVGNGMFISTLYDFNPEGVIRYFPEYVHNGFILLLTERGVVAGLTYLIGLYYLLKVVFKSQFTKITKTVIVGGIISTFTMMLFQPFFNLFSLNILVTGLLVEVRWNGKKD